MGCCSSKHQRDIEEMQEIVRDIDVKFIDFAKTIDAIHLCSRGFISQLEDKENCFTDSRSDFEQLLKKVMNLYKTAIQLLMSIEACKQKKECLIEQVNKDLHSIRRKFEQVLKINHKGNSQLSSDFYPTEEDTISSVFTLENTEITRDIMEIAFSSTVSSIQNKVQHLENELKNMKEMMGEIDNSVTSVLKTELTRKSSEQNQIETKNEMTDVYVERDPDVSERRAFEEFKFKRDMLKNHIETLQKEKEVLEKEITELEIEKTEKEIASTNADTKHKEFENTILSLPRQNVEMKQEFDRHKKKSVYEVQIYRQARGDLIIDIEKELVALLTSRMSANNYEVEFIKCETSNNIQADKPLLLLCINASRLGTDASTLLHGIKVSSKMAILVFHHKDAHALPAQTSDRVLSGPEFKGIGGIYDMAFLAEKRIYSCEMNDNNIVKVIDFIVSCTLKATNIIK